MAYPGRGRYLAGDLLAAVLASSVVVAAAGVALPPIWPTWLAMPLGMALGMALALPAWLAVSPLLGGLEPMIVTMLAGMVAGMAGAMARDAALAELALLGAKCGVAAWAFTVAMDLALRRRPADG